jgi:hypothetical protein
MVVVKLMGGLGNQMFQYALGRRLTYDHNVSVILDISELKKDPLRQYGLHHFAIQAEVVAGDISIPYEEYPIIKEQHYHFDSAVLRIPKKSYLIGYWQSEKYFTEIAPIIRQEFTVQKMPDGLNRQLLEEMGRINAVSLHIRRGDYVSNQVTNKYHGVLPLSYYQQAIQLITQYVKKPYFYIFSDDSKWVRENIMIDYPFAVIAHNGAQDDYEDLRLMSACKHHIIANSSFSWWGAWLSTYLEKVVIAPQQWFNSCPHNTKDLIPENWIRI